MGKGIMNVAVLQVLNKWGFEFVVERGRITHVLNKWGFDFVIEGGKIVRVLRTGLSR